MESRLKLFEITNLFNQFDVSLPLDEKVNIFLGENGMGKTTILNCLYYILSGNIEKLNNIIFDSISLTFVNGEKFSINHNDVSSYVEDYMYGNSPYRRRKVQFERLFTIKELENISKLFREEANEEELKKYYFRVSDVFGMSPSMARRELERYTVQQFQKNMTTKADFNKVITFKKNISEKIDEEILYFPTYRRIEEDMSNLGIDIEKDRVKSRLIQFGISIQNLSSGEKQIISVFSKLYIENIENCIILFDEPELSLSIKWQNMFLPDVVNSGKCSTLIAVTHSPFIFDNEFDDLAKDMGSCLSENE